jgi:class 3 adenylate cyclase
LLAVELLFLRSVPAYTAEEAAGRANVTSEQIVAIRRAVGLPPVAADSRRFNDDDVRMAATLVAAMEFFGPEATMQLVRVIGAAMARIADAAASTFLTTAIADGRMNDNVVANQTAASMMPGLLDVMDTLLRRHIVNASRHVTRVQGGFEAMILGVGFVDIVGSSQLARTVPLGEIGVAVAEFERRTADIVTDHGGRIVKFIGDEAMFVTPDARAVCDVTLTILDKLASNASLPPARAGAAFGEVLVRDADVFGPVVNLAARATKAARAGTLVVPDDLRQALAGLPGFTFEPLPPQALKGFDDTALFEVTSTARQPRC